MAKTDEDIDRIAVLKRVLHSDDQSVRFNSGLDLVKLGDVDGIPALIEAFEHESGVVRLFYASNALVELGKAAIPALTAALEFGSSQTRVDAAYTLYKIDNARLEVLLPIATDTLRDENFQAVRDALYFLSEIGAAAKVAVPALLQTLRAPNELEDLQDWVGDWINKRVLMMALLVRIAEPLEDLDEVVSALIEMLNHEAASLRWGSTLALGEIGAAAKAAVPTLMAMVRDEAEAETVRVEAAYALAVMGDPATEVVPVLLDAIRSPDWWMRLFAARILGEIGILSSQDQENRNFSSWIDNFFFARRNVRRIDDPAQIGDKIVPALAEALADANYNVRRNAAFALSRIGERAVDAIPMLIESLRAEDIGPVAAEAFAKVGKAAILSLGKALEENDKTLRRHSAYALKLIDIPEALDAVKKAEGARLIDQLKPLPQHFYVQVSVTLDTAKVEAFEALYQATLARGIGSEVNYTPPYPKHEFLRYLVEHKGLLLHGSSEMDIEMLKPLRWSTDTEASGNVSGVYADKDPIRPIYFAVINSKRCFGKHSGFFEPTEDDDISRKKDQDEKDRGSAIFDRRFYKLTIGVNGLRWNPWQNGIVYILPPDTFEFWGVTNEWTSRLPVQPLMKLKVVPADLPLRDEVWGVDWRKPGSGWVDPKELFPFLKEVHATPVHPSGRPPWG